MKKQLLFFVCSLFLSFSVFAQTELILNGDFTYPDDGEKYMHIYEIEHWQSDDTITDHHGREYLDGENTIAVAYMNNDAGSIYQIVGDVPAIENTYQISLSASMVWNSSPDDTVSLTVKISAFSGSDPAAREKIDSINFEVTDPQESWTHYEDIMTLEGGSPHAGENLVFEFDITKHIKNPEDDNIWVRIDTVSVEVTPTAVYMNTLSDLNIFPVPADNIIHLESETRIQKVILIDVSGREVKNLITNSNNIIVNIEDLLSGIYFIRIQSERYTSINKIIIK